MKRSAQFSNTQGVGIDGEIGVPIANLRTNGKYRPEIYPLSDILLKFSKNFLRRWSLQVTKV